MQQIFQNMIALSSTILATIVGLVAEKPLYDTEFMDKFSDPEDKKKLNDKVRELKESGDKSPHTIELKNNDKVTIVVN
ncbi:MAG: hypothetical protein Q4A00_04015 [Flavobacteriaceae bacterium]|nr:hypothetical protein [Flavobacteriaceae bacterium]